MKDFAVTIDHLPYCEIEGRVEIVMLDRGCPAQTYGPPEHCYPGDPVEIELGRIEQIINHVHDANGKRRDIYDSFPDDALGKLLEQAVRDALEADADFMEAAADYALEQDAGDRADAMERRWEERREQRAMEAAE